MSLSIRFNRELTLSLHQHDAQAGLRDVCKLWGTRYENNTEFSIDRPWKGMLGVNRSSSPRYIDGAKPFICGGDGLFKPLMQFIPENVSRIIKVSGKKFVVTHFFKPRPKIEKEEAVGYEHFLIERAPPFATFSFKEHKKSHEMGNARCNVGGCGIDVIFYPYPRICKCGGFIHQSHHLSMDAGDPTLRCDRCGKTD